MITLTTDFGCDYYVAEMKGVIYSMGEKIQVVDVRHNIAPQNIAEAAFILSRIWRFFPEKTIHVGVVDPDVGSERKSIIVETKKCFFVGPDNGIFSLALKNQETLGVYEINPARIKNLAKIKTKTTSKTFQGRDIFAPTAALIAKGFKPSSLGRKIGGLMGLNLKPETILYIDSFGNIITNVGKKCSPGERIIVEHKKKKFNATFVEKFSDAAAGKLIALVGSHGFLEVDINKGNAAKKLGANIGDSIKIRRCSLTRTAT